MIVLEDIVNQINSIDLLTRNTLNITHKVEIVEQLDKAETLINSNEWENFILDMNNNEIYLYLYNKDKILLKEWNSVVRELKKKINTVSAVEDLITKSQLRYTMKAQILFDLVGIGACLNYKKLFNLNFPFHELLYEVYRLGYIPVGYKGSFPSGVIQVY